MRALALLLFLMSTLSQAQDRAFVHHTPSTQYLLPEEADPAYVLFNDVPVHAEPAVDAPVLLKATAGEVVEVLEATDDTLVLNGVMSHWYRVAVRNVEGWTWGGNLAQRSFGSHGDPTVKFVAGIDHVTPSDTGRYDFSYRLVAVKNGCELDRIVVRSFAWGFEELRDHGDRGLRSVDDVITLSVSCVGGCGCATGEEVVFWSGGRFHHVADLMGTPDGEFSENVGFVYPSDMEGEANTIARVTSTYEEPEAEEEVPARSLMRILRREYLQWDGKSLVPSGRAMEELRYEMTLD